MRRFVTCAIICKCVWCPDLDRVEAGHNLGHELGHDHHHHAGEEPGLQEQGLHNLRDIEQEVWAIVIAAVDGGQLGGEKHAANNENLQQRGLGQNIYKISSI